MTTTHGFCTTKPIALWNRAIRTDFRQLFLNLAVGTLHLATHNWQEAASNALEALASIELAPNDCGAQAWLLIHRALTEAIFQLAKESAAHLQQTIADPEQFVASLNLEQTLEEQPLCLDHSFFLHPERCPLLEQMDRPLRHWLTASGTDPAQAQAIAQRLPSYFVFALNNQWRNHPEAYRCLQQEVATPFTQAAAREQGWNHYRAWLQKQVDEPLLTANISLRTLYIPLRGWYTEPAAPYAECAEQTIAPPVVDLHDTLWQWLHAANPDDAVRLVCGGPGSGKTTLAKMLAAAIANEGKRTVLFIPLHLLPVQLDLVLAVKALVAADPYCHSYSPLEEMGDREQLLLICDGLEEWAMQSDQMVTAARQWLEDVWHTAARFNQRETRLQVLITARDPLCTANSDLLRRPGQWLHLLSYCPATEPPWRDHPELPCPTDQRPAWWTGYAQATGRLATALPAPCPIDNPFLAEITAHPLTNHLLAQGLASGQLDSIEEEGLNRIYRYLLTEIVHRTYEGGRNPATRGWTEEALILLLEEMAVTAWQGRGWTASLGAWEAVWQTARQKGRLDRRKPEASEGMLRILTAFGCRPSAPRPDGAESYSFLQPGFAQFLTARRIVRLIQQVSQQLKLLRTQPDKGWNEARALRQWVLVCGPSPVDDTLFAFVRRELASYTPRTVWEWQKRLATLLDHLLQNGLPRSHREWPSSRAMDDEGRNAELALLAALNGCARHTGRRSPKWVTEATAFGTWLHHLRRQRSATEPGTGALNWLSHLDLSGAVLRLCDLYGADLQATDLRGADLFWANLGQARLQERRPICAGPIWTRPIWRGPTWKGSSGRGAVILS
ncbi:MAG: NACHT domain-containing protein [Magnetococcales bacterium]|nr:NACHT domain-containing protein [Magnetococcales bacterium]